MLRLSRIGDRAMSPDADTIFRREIQLLGSMYGESIVQGSRLRTVTARYWSGAWPSVAICVRSSSSRVFGAPALGEADEEAPIAGEAILDGVGGSVEGELVGVICHEEPGYIGDIFAEGLMAIDGQIGKGL